MELVLDIVIIIMVAVMIFFAVVLNIKLKTFRNAQSEMRGVVGQLNEVVSRAQASVETLKKTVLTEEDRLDRLVTKSRLLVDELQIITESGSNLADRIERGLVPAQKIEEPDDSLLEDADQEPEYEEEDIEDSEMLKTLKKIR